MIQSHHCMLGFEHRNPQSIKQDVAFIQGRPMNVDCTAYLKLKHGLDPKKLYQASRRQNKSN